MGIDAFFKITGLKEDFIQRLESDKSEETLIPLIFTKPRIRKVCEDIKNYSEKAKGITTIKVIAEAGYGDEIKDFVWDEDFNRDLGTCTLLEMLGIRFEFDKKLGRKLDKLYRGKEKNYKEYQEMEHPSFNPDYINLWWDIVPHNKRYWYTTLRGRPTCAENFRKAVTENIEYHEVCQSPKEYMEFCGNLTRILRKYAFPYQKNEDLHHP
jgi:hypothetical protein